MKQIWFTSDTHYGHSNIVRGQSKWDGRRGTRDFETVEEMNAALVEGINKHVKKHDILYHLGDWSFGGRDNIEVFRNKLNVDIIHLCFGNHDHHIVKYEAYRELFCTTQSVRQMKLEGHEFFLSHYSHRVWDRAHHGAIHLYGHSHDSLEDYQEPIQVIETGACCGPKKVVIDRTRQKYKCMDVGMDSAKRILGEYRPFSIDEVLMIMAGRVPLVVDHHNHTTN